jgi:hypothetical protein
MEYHTTKWTGKINFKNGLGYAICLDTTDRTKETNMKERDIRD